MNEKLFSPADYEFKWSIDGLFRWDKRTAHRLAKMTRDTELKKFQKDGLMVKPFVRKAQRLELGPKGILGKPRVYDICDVYGIKFLA